MNVTKKITVKKSGPRVSLLRGLAPAEMNRFTGWIYTLIRMTYLLFTGSVLPLALIYANQNSSFSNFNPLIGWLFAAGGMIWSLMYIGLEQYSFPVKASGSIGIIAGMISNAWSGYTLSGLNVFYGAYHVLMSVLLAQLLFMSFITVRFSYMKFINSEEGDAIGWWYFIFLAAASLSLGILFFTLIGPVWYEFTHESDLLLLSVSIIFFIYETFSDGMVLWNGSVFNKNVMAFELRNQLHEKWAAFSALTIISSLLASLVTGLWEVK